MNNYQIQERIRQLENQRDAINGEIAVLQAKINNVFEQNFEGQIFASKRRYMKVVKDNRSRCLCLFFSIQDNFYENDDDNKNYWLGENIPKNNEFEVRIDLKWTDKETVIRWSKYPAKIEELNISIKKLIYYFNEHF